MKLIATDKADAAADQPIWPMYRALVGIATLCALLIVGVYLVTRPVIDAKRAAQLENAVFRVLPGAVRKSQFYLSADGTLSRTPLSRGDRVTLYAGYDKNDALVGVALQASGMGYQDAIRLLYGYSPASQTLIGMQVLDSKETPGLGDRVEKDADFLANFSALDVSVDTATGQLHHPVVAVKHGTRTRAWQIDGITGATISSQAIAAIIRQSTSAWVPGILKNRQAFLFSDDSVSGDSVLSERAKANKS